MTAEKVHAQLIPDDTLESESSIVAPIDQLNDRIEGGASRGTNLFHSFLEFNVGAGRSVYFANPTGVDNILSRVTGSNPSNIFGKLGVLGTANLFLINPNGILFGANASLDIQGSFLATTADAIKLGETGYFSATQPQNSNLLSVSPGTLFFNQVANQPAAITNQGNLLAGQDFTLSADNLDLQGQLGAGANLTLQAQDTVKIRDSVTSPFIAAAREQLVIQGNQKVDIFALNHPNSGFFSGGDMVLRSTNAVGGDAHYFTGGSFRIEQLNGSLGSLLAPFDPIIRSQGDVSFFAYQGTSLHILAGGSVNIGIVFITGTDALADTINPTTTPTLANVTLSDGTTLVINGNARPTLDIRAGMNPAAIGSPVGTIGNNPLTDFFFSSSFLLEPPPTNNSVATGSNITIAQLIIAPPDGVIFLTNQFQPNLLLPTGNINLAIGVAGSTTGNGSSVILDSRNNITLANGLIETITGAGDAGNVTLLANNQISLTNFRILTDTLGAGRGGDINLKGSSVSLTDGSILGSRTAGTGDGGNVRVNATEFVELRGSDATGVSSTISTQVQPMADGNAGELLINTGKLIVQDGAQLTNVTSGIGDSGTLTINALESVLISGESPTGAISQVSTQATPGSSGNAGDLLINTGKLIVQDGAQLTNVTSGIGDSGTLTINALESVLISGESPTGTISRISTQATPGSSGDAGELLINTGKLIVQDGAQLTNVTSGIGDSGTLTINALESVLVSGESPTGAISGISTQATPGSSGDAGDLTITTKQLQVLAGGQIDASTFGDGQGGNLLIQAAESVELVGTNANGTVASNLGVNSVGVGANAGDGGTLQIDTGRLIVREGAQIGAGTFGGGDGGTLKVNATESVEVSGRGSRAASAIFNVAAPGSTGNAGNIQIETGQINIQDEGIISVSTDSLGNGGDLDIKAVQLIVQRGGKISGSTGGAGDSGSVTINTSDSVVVSGESAGGKISSVGVQALAGTGNARDLTINTRQLLVQNGGQIATSTFSDGKGGNLLIQASESVEVIGTRADGTGASNLGVSSNPGATGDSGRLEIDTGRLIVRDGAQVGAGTFGDGDGGTLRINARESVEVSGRGPQAASSIFTATEEGSTGNAGNLQIDTAQLTIQDGAALSASTSGTGRTGSIFVQNADSVSLNNGKISTAVNPEAVVNSTAAAQEGNIEIQTQTLSLTNGAQLTASTSGQGDAGSIFVRQADSISLDNSSISTAVEQGAVGQGGSIQLQTQNLSLTNNANVSAETSGIGSAGSVLVGKADSISLDNNSTISTAVNEGATATQPSSIDIQTRLLSIANNSSLSASTAGNGDAGNLSVREAEVISLDNSSISTVANQGAEGQGGNIEIQTQNVSLTNNANMSAAATGQADSGSISVRATNSVSLTNSTISTETQAGEGGNISLQDLDRLDVFNSRISASTQSGTAGNVSVNASESVQLSGILADGTPGGLLAEATAGGNARSLTINTQQLTVEDGAAATVSSTGSGAAGELNVTAKEVVLNNQARLTAETQAGIGGNITLQDLGTLQIRNNLISASTKDGTAGSISVNATESIQLSGTLANGQPSGILAQATGDGTAGQLELSTGHFRIWDGAEVSTATAGRGNAGNIDVQSNSLSLTDGGKITSRSTGSGNAGNINLTAEQTLRVNNGEITASAVQAGGGNIQIRANDIRLRNSSLISTSVFDGTGGGGNLTINSDTFIALEDSDILANAFRGAGGNITINSEAFLADFFSSGKATAVGRNPGDFARFRGNDRVDISASSTLGISGTVTFPEFSFLSSLLASLSSDFVNPDQVVANSCIARRNAEQGSFTVTGTGGLPLNPYDTIRGHYEVVGVQTLGGEVGTESSPFSAVNWQLGSPVTEAQGMMVTAEGRIVVGTTPQLVAFTQAQDLICHPDKSLNFPAKS